MPVATRVRTAAVVSAQKMKSMSRSSKHRRLAGEIPALAIRSNGSVGSSCSSDSSSHGSSKKIAERRRRMGDSARPAPAPKHDERADAPERRCDWITQFSDPLYIHFHDKEWGVPIRDDKKLFELLVFSQALAELQWPIILNNRELFRKCFVNFDPSSVAQLDERRLSSLKVSGSALLSETKLRAIIENAKQTVKIQKEYSSFSNYCWSFVQHRPIQHGFRYAREIPIKTPKAEVISKNLRQKGFTCVGPTIVYSFMQAAGMVNDHLTSCFRFKECKSCIHEQPPT